MQILYVLIILNWFSYINSSEVAISAGLSALPFGVAGTLSGKTARRVVTQKIPNEAGVVRELITEADQIFYRVFSGDKNVGSFLTAVKPKSSVYAQEALALPRFNTADFIQEVLVPAGTSLKRSRAAPIKANDMFPNRRGGAEQFELQERIPIKNFGIGKYLQ